MFIAWTAPAALIGIALIAVPIAIHLLVRQHARTMSFPSLRFLRDTQLAALRRRRIEDGALLACRVAIIALAAVAMAGPILQTAARSAGYADRTSRAVVSLDGAGDGVSAAIAEDAFASATFRRPAVADALSDAVRWLAQQPPSAREIVVAGTLRRGTLAESDLAIIPPGVGVRFQNAAETTPNDVTWPVLARRDGALVRIDRAVHFETDATRVADGQAAAVRSDLISIVAQEAETALAEAALRAVLDAGISWSEFDRPTRIVWQGADAAAINRAEPGAQIIRMPVPSPSSTAADALLEALRGVSPRPDRFEPVMLTPDQLAAWSRQPGSPLADAPLRDGGDRRWLWGAALVLLAVEAWMRRSRPEIASVADQSEARVA
ncbi:MAG: BatA domain-containing protein [Vicinamibacterales bacterium]